MIAVALEISVEREGAAALDEKEDQQQKGYNCEAKFGFGRQTSSLAIKYDSADKNGDLDERHESCHQANDDHEAAQEVDPGDKDG